ncbi:nitrate/sulfonate/bicarbonate ABC transporter ATP-binding protein [Rhizobium sp. Leaf371]|uniref:ABC transporter ATP-binding protein n=1 Tax=Rhizobium sp. Leaf371 TaxID=1736355 RepID=UPI000712E579|nr:ABC transporter ATP-binding protein [Rhizobium sp. Leaf371]KQS71736.1 nitrate/sulfonate/bicarbonate ABC transporter ATP-binding protein [Rhizobium sp. Leaf371]
MLALKGLGKTYAGGVQALAGFTLDARPGEIVAIIGGSGCGKSTLLRLIGGLDAPTSGTVSIHGETVHEPHPLINLIFQEPRLLPWLSVRDNVGFGLAHLPRAEQAARIEEALCRVNLEAYGDRLPKALSGGQAQRVAIARALVTRPEVLLLDEPFSALDALTRETLQQHLLDIWAQTRATMILVTHDIDEAVSLAHRVIVLKPWPGRILDDIKIAHPHQRSGVPFEQARAKVRSALHQSLSVPAPADIRTARAQHPSVLETSP